MSLLGFDAIGRLALGQLPGATAALVVVPYPETPTPVRSRREAGYRIAMMASGGVIPPLLISAPLSWFAPLAEPVRLKPGLRAAQQQFLAQSNPLPFVSFSWFEELSKPQKLDRPGLAASHQQFFAYSPNPTTVTPFAWFASLSEPVRHKHGLAPRLQQFFATDPDVIPTTTAINGWFSWLSEPVRFKLALRTPLQQFYTGPPRLLPNPDIFGIMSALETKDTFLAGAMLWNRATNAEIAVINTTPQPAEIGLYQTAPTAGTITVRISIVIG